MIVVIQDPASRRRLAAARRRAGRPRRPSASASTEPTGLDGLVRRGRSAHRRTLLRRRRSSAVDVARAWTGAAPALVDGPSAELADQRASLSDHLPLAIAIIVVTTPCCCCS